MTIPQDTAGFRHISRGYNTDPARSFSLNKLAYLQQKWFDIERTHIIKDSWQWVCHKEKLLKLGSYVATEIAEMPICVIRDQDNKLNAFYNVCKHRAMQLLGGDGSVRKIVCPYHGWTYDLRGKLIFTPATENLQNFKPLSMGLEQVQVEEFCGFIYVNLNPDASPLAEQSGDLANEIMAQVADLEAITFAQRFNYTIKSNWKNVVDNFLECYHCTTAHKDFCTLIDMDTYQVTTHGIYSSHLAKATKTSNSAYPVGDTSVKDPAADSAIYEHAVWWLWPNTCIMRYPGKGNMIIMQIIPAGPELTLSTYDFFFESSQPEEQQKAAMKYLNEVLQAEDIALMESVQKGMKTPAFKQGRIVHNPDKNGKSEHAVHHFHGLILDAYKRAMVNTSEQSMSDAFQYNLE